MGRCLGLACMLLWGVGCNNPEAPPVETPDLLTPGCADDSQCMAPTPRCDLNSHKCVTCLPANDNCPQGQRCVPSNGSFICTTACVIDGDCPKTDAGTPMSCCSGGCYDTSSDTQNCGRCGSSCQPLANANAACTGGMCTIGKCNPGFLDCDHGDNTGCEVDGTGDAKNCGSCGKACTGGAHQSFACTGGACSTACVAGFGDCDGNGANGCESDLATDGMNCGACGKLCALANASAVCKMGACAIDACNPGFDDCNMMGVDGCEADLKKDVGHCSNCANACMVANGTPICRSGSCGIDVCKMGFADCNSLVLDGCEVSLMGDIKNCGACARKCQGSNSVQDCQIGSCAITMCSAGYADCDKKPDTGCEVQVAGDILNCGACGKACPVPANGSAGCANGVCGIGQCKFGFADCNKNANDGCEADLLGLSNCGNCGIVCMASPNATAACNAGVCGIGMCSMQYGDCDGNPMNGCEKNMATDVMNCGKCGAACTVQNGMASCAQGVCGVLSCNMGFGDCDQKYATGCEVNTQTDIANCGACGKACGQGQVCMNGACTCAPCSLPNAQSQCVNLQCAIQACNMGFADCDKQAQNGCEAPLNWDANNCGMCSNVCQVNTPSCEVGVCAVEDFPPIYLLYLLGT